MADVPDLGTVIVNEFGRIEKFEGKSYVFKIIQTLPYLGLPTRSKRYWCKEHENIRNADFLKVQWLSEAGGDDGHWAAEHKTIADESITELVLRKEVSYIPAYMLEQIVIVFHVDEELIYNTKGMSDVFVVTRREKKNVKELELLPRGDHVTFTRPLDFLGSPKKIRVLSTMSWTLRLFLRKAIHNVLIGLQSDKPDGFTITMFDEVWWGIAKNLFDGAREKNGVRQKTSYDSDEAFTGSRAREKADTEGLMFETPAELELIVKVLGVGCLGIMNRTTLRGLLNSGMPCEPSDFITMRIISAPSGPPPPGWAPSVPSEPEDNEGAEGEGEPQAKKRACAPPGVRFTWSPLWGGSLSVRLSWLSMTHHDTTKQ